MLKRRAEARASDRKPSQRSSLERRSSGAESTAESTAPVSSVALYLQLDDLIKADKVVDLEDVLVREQLRTEREREKNEQWSGSARVVWVETAASRRR